MVTYQATPDYYNDYISHHGILGQKWGKKNGPPYPLDSKVSTGKKLKKWVDKHTVTRDPKSEKSTPRFGEVRNGKIMRSSSDLINASVEAGVKEFRENAEKKIKEADLYSPNYSNDTKDPKKLERAKQAADLGIKAMIDINPSEKEWVNNMGKGQAREWFLYEDQTIGMPTIADLVLRGKTKKEINELKKYADRLSENDSTKGYEPGIFDLINTPKNDKFVDSCIKIKNNVDSKIDEAIKTDKWDINFIESVQNEPYFDDIKKMGEEYRKYLLKNY